MGFRTRENDRYLEHPASPRRGSAWNNNPFRKGESSVPLSRYVRVCSEPFFFFGTPTSGRNCVGEFEFILAPCECCSFRMCSCRRHKIKPTRRSVMRPLTTINRCEIASKPACCSVVGLRSTLSITPVFHRVPQPCHAVPPSTTLRACVGLGYGRA